MLRRFFGALLCAAALALAPLQAHATALSITAANVSLVSGAHDSDQIAGEAFAAGAAIYQKSTDLKWYKAQCDGTAEEAGSFALGVALATADAAGARISVARDGAIVSLGTGTAGKIYVVGTTYGAINPTADMDATSTNKITVLGIGIGSNQLLIQRVYNAGAVVP